MNRRTTYTLAVLVIANVFCLCPTLTPSPPPTQGPGIPSGQNEQVVNGSKGTPPLSGIPVYCENSGPGKVNIPPGSFEGTTTIQIDCLSTDETAIFHEAVRAEYGDTGEFLGAIKLSPSGMEFSSLISITIPLIKPVYLPKSVVDVYVFVDENSKPLKIEQAVVSDECLRWCAMAPVDHFTTFIAYESTASTAPPSAPVIENIEVPTTWIGDNSEHIGYIYFYDANGDVNRVTFEDVLDNSVFADFDPGSNPYKGDRFVGAYQIIVGCEAGSETTESIMRITLYDQTGLKSNSVDHRYVCQVP